MKNTTIEELRALMQHEKRICEISKDYIIDTTRVQAIPHPDGKNVLLDVEGLGTYDIYPIAHNQISEKTQIPLKYYDRVKEKNPKLLADNINEWLPNRDYRMIRTLDLGGDKKVCRALLSNRYKQLDNYDLLLTTLNTFNDYEARTGNKVVIKQAYSTDESFYIKALMPHLKTDVKPNDILMAGLVVSNSEVGKRALAISPLTCRQICMNDAISSDTYRRNHIGEERRADIYSDITRQSQNNTIWLEVSDVLKATLSGKFLEEKAQQYRELAGIQYDLPKEKIKEVIKAHKFSEEEGEKIIDAFLGDADKSAYGIMNAITSIAKDSSSIDRQIEIEKIGDKVALNLLGKSVELLGDVELLGEGV